MKHIIFYGPTGKGSPPDKIGGGEKGCQRTIALYTKLGIDIIVVEKPTLFKGIMTFVIDSITTPFILMKQLFTHPHTPVHIVGFYENQMYYEYMIFLIAKLFSRKTVYELRNGTMVRTIENHSFIYRKVMKSIILGSEVVLCQGMEYMDYIAKTWKAYNTIYYPNYIMSNFMHSYNEQRTD